MDETFEPCAQNSHKITAKGSRNEKGQEINPCPSL
nr:MAG TPA: hypothetical protein [Caudoviricetes sp.]